MRESDYLDQHHRPAFVLLAGTISVTVLWIADISWQASTPARPFWSPFHVALYLCGGLVGVCAFWLVRKGAYGSLTFRRAAGFVVGTGASLILLAAGFDSWWHETGEIEPRVLTWPHMVVALAVITMQAGTTLIMLPIEKEELSRPARRLKNLGYVVAIGLVLLGFATLASEYVARPNLWHGSEFYRVSGALFPLLLAAVARSSRLRWGATAAAATYMLVVLLMIWTLQSLSTPGAADPAAHRLTHLMPPPFPLLLLVPAYAIDVLHHRLDGGVDWRRDTALAGLMGLAFIGLMIAGHWYYAELLLSPAGQGTLLAADRWPYHVTPGDWQYRYWTLDPGTRRFVFGLGMGAVFAALSAWAGLWLGARLAELRTRGA